MNRLRLFNNLRLLQRHSGVNYEREGLGRGIVGNKFLLVDWLSVRPGAATSQEASWGY
jgi:hypothetical protein